MTQKFRIYPSIGVARLGNGPAEKDQVVFSPEIPWANLYETNNDYLTEDGKVKKQAQRFYIYECDDNGVPVKQISPADYEINWFVEVANKKPFWYDFNNSLDLSIESENRNIDKDFAARKIAPGIAATQRNPNVLNMIDRIKSSRKYHEALESTKSDSEYHAKLFSNAGAVADPELSAYNYRMELVNRPPVAVVNDDLRKTPIGGQFPYKAHGKSLLAATLKTSEKEVNLGTIEYDEDGTLIFYAGDGVSAALNPSDVNTDFADNSNWYDDICDGRITATVRGKDGTLYEISDATSAAWVTTAPPDYAPQIQPICTMYDIMAGASSDEFRSEVGLVFPLLYRMYRMQWVNLGDFLAPSFRETIDKLTAEGKFPCIYRNDRGSAEVRKMIFDMFRNPAYPVNNEPIIPSNSTTSIANKGVGTDELKLPYYPGDGINYPGSPAQWFAIPPILYDQLRKWKDGEFTSLEMDFRDIDALGEYYRQQFLAAAADERKKPLLMTRAVMETLYGGGFHPGVELTWPMRHNLIYAQNTEVFKDVYEQHGLYGLREVRINSATPEEQQEIFFNDFGLQMGAEDIRRSMTAGSDASWLWKITPGDLTKWMGIPWQSDAGSCQNVFIEKQYPVPAWWAANLPVTVLPEDSYLKLLDDNILEDTKRMIYANRLEWLHTTNTGFVGYHAEGGYMNGLISMVYQWKEIGFVTGRRMEKEVNGKMEPVNVPGVPEIVYVAYMGKQTP